MKQSEIDKMSIIDRAVAATVATAVSQVTVEG